MIENAIKSETISRTQHNMYQIELYRD